MVAYGGTTTSGTTLTSTKQMADIVYKAPATTSDATALSYSSGSGTSYSGTGGTSGGISDYEARQNAKEAAYKAAASERYRLQAATLQKQVNAIKLALNGGYLEALNQRLANVNLVTGQQDNALMEGFRSRVTSLEGAEKDNEKAYSDTNYTNATNRGRERANAVSEALSHGAGESDVLRSQLMSLRNWDSNQNEANRSFFDSLRSVNSSLTDLNQDTKTGRLNLANQANADRDQLWTQYYNQQSEGYTQLGNLAGQQAEYYGMAKEQVDSAKNTADQKAYAAASGGYFTKASNWADEAYVNPGIPAALRDWKGQAEFEATASNTLFQGANTNIGPRKKPEGATLRTW